VKGIGKVSDVQTPLAALALIAVMLGVSWAVRRSTSTTLDFYLANRQVGPFLNACAICGDYFSAASFLGVAGAVYASGLDGVWFATGFAAGFLVVLFFLAAPLRRAGQFSIPDFLAHRFNSPHVRLTAVAIVQLIVLLYLVPQMAGAGLVWEVFVGRGLAGASPYVTGVLLSTVVIVIQAVVGGMKGTTWNQALQFGLKGFTVFLLAMIALGHGFDYPKSVEELSRRPLSVPVEVSRNQLLSKDGELLTQARLVMSKDGFASLRGEIEAGGDRFSVLLPAKNRLHPERPMRFGEPGYRYTLWGQIALIVTLLLGTAGLPHITNRYFTSTSGRAARTSTVWVLGIAGLFYFFAVQIGVAARQQLPGFVGSVTNSDFVDGVARVPEKALLLLAQQLGGESLLALVSAAALAAVFSTVAGLLLAAATSWGHDVYEQFINPAASERRRIMFGRAAVSLTAVLAAALGILVRVETPNAPSVALMVTWAFGVAGSALTPVFLLGVWWKRMTAKGALAGMIVGGLVALGLIGAELLSQFFGGIPATSFFSFPTLIAAPLAALSATAVSIADERADPTAWWVRVHGTAQERRQALLARLAARSGGAA
jgi:cation/acetate symporter